MKHPQDHWIRNMVGVCGVPETRRGFVIHCWLSVWTDAWSVIFSQYCIHLLRKHVRTDLLLC